MKKNLLSLLAPYVENAEKETRELPLYVEMASVFSRVNSGCVYLLDYIHGNVPFVSSRLLADIVRDDLQGDITLYLSRYVSWKDRDKIIELSLAGRTFINKQPLEKRKQFTLTYEFKLFLNSGKSPLFIARHITPLAMTSDGKIWLSLGIMTVAPKSHEGKAFLHGPDGDIYLYSFVNHQWEAYSVVPLNSKEKQILNYTAEGLSEEAIANEIFLSRDSVKGYKKHLFKKLEATNMLEAVTITSVFADTFA